VDSRRTLAQPNPSRDLKPSELRVGFYVSLKDSMGNSAIVRVTKITKKEMFFLEGLVEVHEIILTRKDDMLLDGEGRIITAWGRPNQRKDKGD
jgi:hypothetical protein